MMNITDFMPLLPEASLAFSALALLMIAAFSKGQEGAIACNRLAVLALLLVGTMVLTTLVSTENTAQVLLPAMVKATALSKTTGLFGLTSFVVCVKVMVILAAVLTLLIAPGFLTRNKINRPEYAVLVLFAVLGMMLMLSATSFMMLYIGLELQSLALYVLAAFNRDETRSTEAGLKYFVLGSLASGVLLYGISLIYGFAGSVDFATLAEVLTADSAKISGGLIVGLVFVLAAMAFKISAAPLHMWAPDVYEGAPTPVTAFFSVAPKLAAMGLLMQLLFGPFGGLKAEWQPMIVGLAALSMLVGAFGGLLQQNIKRLLAYSSIGHVGFALMALAAGTAHGVEAVLIYLGFYVLMSVGAFCVVLSMRRDGQMLEQVSDLAGVSRQRPGLAAAMAILMFSMAGLPPLVGFFSKFYVFVAALQAGLIGLALIGAVASVVGAYYYLRIIKVMYFDEPVPAYDCPDNRSLCMVMLFTSGLTLGGVMFFAPFTQIAMLAARALTLVP